MAGAILIAGACEWAPSLRRAMPVEAHIARPDPFDDDAYFAEWAGANPGVDLRMHRYEGGGHYFLDPALPDYHAESARLCRERMLSFLNTL
ncbi:dienelactone hydrolase family protein [Wenxinia marina]|uniref:Dienelactone hydrolase n=1 Tax=Wenxinia marina DSM 24838 TaxID=1123501 RepID=A0A0D0Q7Y3_9RHOB|nr:dienelactone hydrolase family protein [Wenxinia marina]KIQ68552.1 Dienelactone hydrolase [Wenxinia marina DSM 24838]GGL66831.1 hypothetical protein GCM10011392_21660 [Wenxinia marina]